ncbi:MAG: cold-shock protein [Sphingomonadaceae bacterium]
MNAFKEGALAEALIDDDRTPVAIQRLTGSVKWFDATRGFGFVQTVEGDVLIHFSLLREHDRRSLPEGATVDCEAARGTRGLQATSVLAIDVSTATGPDLDARRNDSRSRVDLGALLANAGPPEPVRVKWFNRLKGYGFVVRESGGQDIFLHMETLRRAGVVELEPEQPLNARIVAGEKGPLAVEVQAV